MGLRTELKKCGIKYLDRRQHKKRLFAEIAKFEDPRRKKIYESVTLTPEQEKQIDDIYITHYGKKIPYIWHRHYTAFTGKFDPFYIPELLFIPEFEYYMNSNRAYISAFEDKNVLSLLAKSVGVYMPQSIISCANGILRDSTFASITWDDAVNVMPDGTCFAKPTTDSGSGKGCRLFDKGKDKISLLKSMGDNFVVQERIICSDDIRCIYPGSVNTFRVITYIWDGKIQIAPVIMRIGRNGSYLDNAHAGGIFIAVSNDGTLHKMAFTEFRDVFYEHPDTHVIFEGYKIHNFEEVLNSAVKMHMALPQLGVINWDFTIDKENKPVLIEANTSDGSIWLPQMAWGKGVFGKDTISILEWLREENSK